MTRLLPLGMAVALLVSACAAPPVRPPEPASTPRRVQIPPPRVTVVDPVEEPPAQQRHAPPTNNADGPPDPDDIPEGLADLPDPVPQAEPKSRSGNSKKYQVFGKTYHVLNSSEGFRETGLASWYGKKFHGRKTASGDKYDMFQLTAAHKHLPLPTFVRVTNLANGRTVVVRVNDRGPFHPGRIIDLSYAAAAKLHLVGKIGMVEVEAISPGRKLPPPPKLKVRLQTDESAEEPEPIRTTQRMLQVAAYSDPVNAVAMREELSGLGIDPVLIRVGLLDNGDTVHRVLVGPFDERQRMDQARIRIRGAGFEAIPIAE